MLVACIPPLALCNEDYVINQKAHLFLPQLFVYPQYVQYVDNAVGYKILDNGAAEGYSTELESLIEMAQDWKIDEVVIPDIIGDCDLSIELARWAGRVNKPQGVKFQAVVQGTSVAEALKSFRELRRLEHVDTIAIPRHFNKFHPTSRHALMASLAEAAEFWYEKPIHCLGYHSWMAEIKALARLPIRSLDTSTPFHMAQHGLSLDTSPVNVARQEDFFLWEPDDEQRRLAQHNFNTFVRWAEKT